MQTKRPELAARAGGLLLVHSRLRPPVPRVPWVRRPRLLKLLREGARRPVTVVSAPPGFGKTTLLAQWAREDAKRTPFAWVTLGEDAQDPSTFLSYVIEALRSVDPSIGRQARRRLGGPDPIRAAVPALLNDLDALSARAVLVLDEFDALQEPDTRHWVEFLIENVAGPLHIVVASRSNPLLPVGRLRAQGELSELRADDLRFSPEETDSLLRKQLGVDASDDDIRTLHDATEGWPAGVYLAGTYLKSNPEHRAEDFGGKHRHVSDFLRDEVLHRQPEPIREFMLRTSILDRMSPSLCDAVSRSDGAALMLGDLERSNLFVVPLDDEAEWYRYHRLFRDMLRSEATRVMSEDVPELHRRAAEWHRDHGTAVEAVRHAIASGDHRVTVDLIKASWVDQARAGHRSTVWGWLDALPWDVVGTDPHLCAIASWLLTMSGDFDAAKVWRSRIPLELPPTPSLLADGFSSVESVREITIAHPVHSVAVALRAALNALACEPLGSPWHSSALVALGIAQYLAGHNTEARTTLEDARVESSTAPRPGVEMLADTFLSLVEHDVGDPAAADALAVDARRLMEHGEVVDYPLFAPLYVVSAAAYARSSDRERAEAALEEAARLAAPYGRSIIPALTALQAAKLRLSWGDLAGCRILLREAHACLNACTDPGMLRREFEALDARTRPRAARQDLPEDLTASEVAVLRLLATDLSLGEIAARLFVSINTIKTHTRHIYQKLHAPSRRSAVDRGRALDLI